MPATLWWAGPKNHINLNIGKLETVDNLAENLHIGVLKGTDREYYCCFWAKSLVLEIYLSKIS